MPSTTAGLRNPRIPRHGLMRRYGARLLAAGAATATVLVTSCSGSAFVSHAEPPAPDPNLILASEFDGPEGAPPGAPWRAATGGGGWGNNEAQIYTADPANLRQDGRGNLVLEARTAPDGTITSARITTADAFSFTSGRAEARISLPAGQGLHPAFWLLGSNIDSVGWPASGEIDVIETLNNAADFHTGVHAPRDGSERGREVSAAGPAPFPLAGEFHTYWVERTPGRIVTGIDGMTLLTVTPADLPDGARWVFDQPFHLLLNVAVGGNWPGPPNASTPNPSTMLIDWVRVHKL